MELRSYQKEAIKDIRDAWTFNRNVLLQMPTGTGKTNVFCEVIRLHRLEYPNSRVLVLTHKRELVLQTVRRLRSFTIIPGMILAGHFSNPDHQVQVATIQTLIRRKNLLTFLTNVSLIIIDEAHHSPSSTYRTLIDFYQSENTLLLGVTATPRRSDGRGFADIFHQLIQSWSIKRFIEEKYLADIRHFKTTTYEDIKKGLKNVSIDVKTNDYEESELSTLMCSDRYMADAVESYLRYRNEYHKSIVFAVSINHSKSLAARFISRGVKAVHLDSHTKYEIRESILKDFKNGVISVICNVGIITEGFDCPDTEIVQLVRPTKSITLYLQQVGRVMRPKPHGGYALILDSASCYDEFGSAKANRRWSLDATTNNFWFAKGEDSDQPIETKDPGERPLAMVEVESPSQDLQVLITEQWVETLPKVYKEYFENRFPVLSTQSTDLFIRSIWKSKDVDISGFPVDSLMPLGKLINIQNLDISFTNCDKLRPIMNLNSLVSLNISHCKADILRLPIKTNNLKNLNISETTVREIAILKRYINLRELIMNGIRARDYGSISTLPNLRRFIANDSSFQSINMLWGSRNSLEVIEVRNTKIQDISIVHHFNKLRYLDISDTLVESLDNVAECRFLETLVIKNVSVPRQAIKELKTKRPDLWIES